MQPYASVKTSTSGLEIESFDCLPSLRLFPSMLAMGVLLGLATSQNQQAHIKSRVRSGIQLQPLLDLLDHLH